VTLVSVEVFTAFIVRVGGLQANNVPPVAVFSEKEIGAGATTFALSVFAQPKASCTVTEYVPVVKPPTLFVFPPPGDHV
jgi:hypothetical protein